MQYDANLIIFGLLYTLLVLALIIVCPDQVAHFGHWLGHILTHWLITRTQ